MAHKLLLNVVVVGCSLLNSLYSLFYFCFFFNKYLQCLLLRKYLILKNIYVLYVYTKIKKQLHFFYFLIF